MRVLACVLALGSAGVAANIAVLFETAAQGAGLRIASDLTLGLPLEVWKTRVISGRTKAFAELRRMTNEAAGIKTFYRGWQPRVVESALQGGAYLVGARMGANVLHSAPSLLQALGSGAAGGLAQSLIMTPTSLVLTKTVQGSGSLSTVKSIWKAEGPKGFFRGGGAMALRQTSNWASRSFCQRLAYNLLPLKGTALSLSSGVVGGALSAWNTPLEVARVRSQTGQTNAGVFTTLRNVANEGPRELYRGVIPRAVQSAWQTVFMVVLPTLITKK